MGGRHGPAQTSGDGVPRSAAERLSLGVALLVLGAVVAAVVAVWLAPRAAPPRFVVELGEVRRAGEHYYLAVTVRNDGDRTASEVQVVGVLAEGEGDETADTTFDFIPGRSAAEAVLVFTRDPATARVEVRSFQKP